LTRREKVLLLVLAFSSFFLANILMKPRSITIIVRGNESITIQTPLVYKLWEVIAILPTSLPIGISGTLIVFSGERREKVDINKLINLLEGPERTIMEFIVKRGGKALQREIWSETGLEQGYGLQDAEGSGGQRSVRRERYRGTRIVLISKEALRG